VSLDSRTLPAALAAAPPPLMQNGHLRMKRCRYRLMLYSAFDTYIGRSFDLYGEFAEAEIAIFRQLVRPGQCVFDVGANIGAHTIALAAIVGPHGRVTSFEPQRVIFQMLNANVALNGLHHVTTHQMALGSAAGSLKVPPLDYAGELNFGGLSLEHIKQGEEVRQSTFDSLAVRACDFVKIDVEGMEIEVLKGMAETIQRFRPAMYVENDRRHKSAALVGHLLGLGYRLYYHVSAVFPATNFFANPVNVFGAAGAFNMICLPGERSHSAGGLREITHPNEALMGPRHEG
jgi:FkbM family methyltransferase